MAAFVVERSFDIVAGQPVMQLVEALAQPLGSPEDAALAAAIEHQELLVGEVELAPGARHKASKPRFVIRVAGRGAGFDQGRHERGHRVREFPMCRGAADHASADRHEGVTKGTHVRPRKARLGHAGILAPRRWPGALTARRIDNCQRCGESARDDTAMVRIALPYASRDGQTRRIANRIAQTLQARGCVVEMRDVMAAAPARFDVASCDAAIVASSIRIGKHAPQMVRFVRDHREELCRIPNVFLEVSLSAHGIVDPAASEKRRSRARAAVAKTFARFIRETGWTPNNVHPVAGALLYRQYNFAIRAMLRFISSLVGASTDTSRDHEYTDWASVSCYANELVDRCVASVPAAGVSMPLPPSPPYRSPQPHRTAQTTRTGPM
jgi:menaquinone-dependent protoporphyrinogen oxidase